MSFQMIDKSKFGLFILLALFLLNSFCYGQTGQSIQVNNKFVYTVFGVWDYQELYDLQIEGENREFSWGSGTFVPQASLIIDWGLHPQLSNKDLVIDTGMGTFQITEIVEVNDNTYCLDCFSFLYLEETSKIIVHVESMGKIRFETILSYQQSHPDFTENYTDPRISIKDSLGLNDIGMSQLYYRRSGPIQK